MLTKGKFLVSFEVPGHTKEYTEGFTEEMVIPYRTEELNPYLRYPNQDINNNHPPNKQIKVYHITNPNTNPIHLITNPSILHI